MTVPDVRLHPADAAELAELLQSLDDWLGTDREHLDASLTASSATAATTSATYARTSAASCSCSAATTASGSSETSKPSELGGTDSNPDRPHAHLL